MKKILLFALALVMMLTVASAETALDAFNALTTGTTNDTSSLQRRCWTT